MGLIPGGASGIIDSASVHTPNPTQTGCFYCRKDRVFGPAINDLVYYVNGTSFCGPHLDSYIESTKTPRMTASDL